MEEFQMIIQILQLLLKLGADATIHDPLGDILDIAKYVNTIRYRKTYATVDSQAFDNIMDGLGEMFSCLMLAGSKINMFSKWNTLPYEPLLNIVEYSSHPSRSGTLLRLLFDSLNVT